MTESFRIESVEKAIESLHNNVKNQISMEKVSLPNALGRILSEDIIAGINIPDFDRSTMDGYAVKAKDTFGASEAMPAYLEVTGEILMGHEAVNPLADGAAMKVATGGMLPPGADAVVMVEYTEELDEDTIGVVRPVAPGENEVRKGEDLAEGDHVMAKGTILRPQDLGILSGLGINNVPVFKKPRVGIISTGDEIVPPEVVPKPGQVRDINSYTLLGLVQDAGGDGVLYGIIPDTYERLKEITALALAECDLVIISGGSSVGTRDVTAKVIDNLGQPGVLVHGVSVKPGKPTILGVVEGKAIYGLPGHPVSAMVIFDIFVRPIMNKLQSKKPTIPGNIVKARLSRNIASAAGRVDYLRVVIRESEAGYLAEPVLGKSGLISTMVKADGVFCIPMDQEGVLEGKEIDVILF